MRRLILIGIVAALAAAVLAPTAGAAVRVEVQGHR